MRLPLFWLVTGIIGFIARASSIYRQEASARGLFIKFIKRKHLEDKFFEEFINDIFSFKNKDELFGYITDKFNRLFEADIVVLLKEEGIGLVGYLGNKLSKLKLSKFIIFNHEDIYKKIMNDKQQVEVIEKDMPYSLRRFFIKSMVINPLISSIEEEVIGAICIYIQQEVREFSEDEKILFYKLSTYVANAYSHLLQAKKNLEYQEDVKDYRILTERLSFFSSLQEKDMVSLLNKADEYIKAFGVSKYRIMLIDREAEDLYIVKQSGLSEIEKTARVSLGDWGVGRVASTGEREIAVDIKVQDLTSMDKDSLCILPLKSQGEVIGVFDMIDLVPKKKINLRQFLFLEMLINILADKLIPFVKSPKEIYDKEHLIT
jgi:transcriptional regulator with GAF, ATPase, and Fis domain